MRRLLQLRNVSTLQPVVNFFHDSKAIHISDDIIAKDTSDEMINNSNDNANENNNNNDNNDKEKINASDSNNDDTNKNENIDAKESENDNNNGNDENGNENENDNNIVKKSSYEEHVEKLITDSLSPNAKIVVKCEDSYEFPSDQEITHLEIQSMRKMSDHVLYQILVKNVNREEPYDKWTVMKRFHNIYEMDLELRKGLQSDNSLEALQQMPLMPEKKSKLIHDHMSEPFMEGYALFCFCFCFCFECVSIETETHRKKTNKCVLKLIGDKCCCKITLINC